MDHTSTHARTGNNGYQAPSTGVPVGGILSSGHPTLPPPPLPHLPPVHSVSAGTPTNATTHTTGLPLAPPSTLLGSGLPPTAHHMVATPVPNYYDLYIGALEHAHRLQAALESTRRDNERLRERVTTLERNAASYRTEQPKTQSRYWTPDEHQRFLEALQEFGPKDVRSIATYVGSRNATQVRTHAQKYWKRIERERHKGNALVAARKRSMSESDLARVDRANSSTPPSSPRPVVPRFPLPKPQNGGARTTASSPLTKPVLSIPAMLSSTNNNCSATTGVSGAKPPTTVSSTSAGGGGGMTASAMGTKVVVGNSGVDGNEGINLLSMVANHEREMQVVHMSQ